MQTFTQKQKEENQVHTTKLFDTIQQLVIYNLSTFDKL